MAHDLLIPAQLPADLAAEIEGARDTLAAAKAGIDPEGLCVRLAAVL